MGGDDRDPLLQSAEEDVTRLVQISTDLYTRWESDAAFYTLRAAATVALSPDQCARIRYVAIARRDEWQRAENGITAANHGGSITTDVLAQGYQPEDTYEGLVAGIERDIWWRQAWAQDTTGSELWRAYGWSGQEPRQ